MPAIDLSRPEAFDIANFFAPEIIKPTKAKKHALVFTPEFPNTELDADIQYMVSKLIDHPIDPRYVIPQMVQVLPRGVPWHNFPVVADPFYRIDNLRSRPVCGWPTQVLGASNSSVLAFSDQHVFVPSSDKRKAAEEAFHLGYLLSKYDQEKTKVAVVGEGSEVKLEDATSLRQRMQAELRFRYSYEVNFKAIAMKAFRHVGAVENLFGGPQDYPWDGIRFSDRPFSGKTDYSIHDPLAIQWLFKLRRLGVFDISYAYETGKLLKKRSAAHKRVTVGGLMTTHPRTVPVVMGGDYNAVCLVIIDKDDQPGDDYGAYRARLQDEVKCQIVDELVSAQVFSDLNGTNLYRSERFFSLEASMCTSWIGTGKYHPYPISYQLGGAAAKFVHVGLVEFDNEQENVRLSDKGNRLLDLLHPDCEDPDVMLRWADEEGFFKQGCEKACDDWIMRFFSKMKTKVNEIQ